jgi:NitT/TauT family transport system ATP-binding protein
MMPHAASLSAQRVERSFPDAGPVVDGVSLSIQPGEFVSILGPSGCGKSTFLRMAAGLDHPTRGTLEVSCPRSTPFRSFVFQEAHLVPWRTVLKNVMLPLELLGVDEKTAREKSQDALEKVGLSDAQGRFPSQLSGGMKMRASVARALVTEPAFLLLDEPFSALDELNRHALQDELRRIWETTRPTILFVTHSVSEAVFLSNRVVVFSKKPARLLLDTQVELPPHRDAALRTSAEFGRELKSIYARVSYEEAPL